MRNLSDMKQQLLDTFIFETEKILEQLEQNILICEKEGSFSADSVNEIFRCMHTIKSSSAMMMYNHIVELAHTVEDLFSYIRENQGIPLPTSTLTDFILESMDFIQNEIEKIQAGSSDFQDATELIEQSRNFLEALKSGKTIEEEKKVDAKIEPQPEPIHQGMLSEASTPMVAQKNHIKSDTAIAFGSSQGRFSYFEICIFFYESSGMEGVRAFQIEHELNDHVYEMKGDFEYVLEDSHAPEQIRQNGYHICVQTEESYQDIEKILKGIVLIQRLLIREITEEEYRVNCQFVIFTKKGMGEITQQPEESCIFEDVKPDAAAIVEVKMRPIEEALMDFSGDVPDEPMSTSIFPASVEPEIEADDSVERSAQDIVPTQKAESLDVASMSVHPPEKLKSAVEVPAPPKASTAKVEPKHPTSAQGMICVNIDKLDLLMDLMGELVLFEAMVTRNPHLEGLTLNNFQKSARQHRKIVNELQDVIMDIRMVPVSGVFQKMNRIIRDLNKKQGKDVILELIGEDTEMDKNFIEKIGDPLMHMVRNSMDHGIESPDERKRLGKTGRATITIEAKNIGREVLVVVKDNGRGLNREKILRKAEQLGLLSKDPRLMTEREIYALILRPGFSTREKVTEYSGRGVGMDVVVTNIQAVGGSVAIDSVQGEGTTFAMKIPLTLAIIEGMIVRVGQAKYTLPITSVRESFRTSKEEVIVDPDGNEMIEVRGACYPIIRLNHLYQIPNGKEVFEEGILIMIESDHTQYGLFVDELICEQQVVVKPLPEYIKNFNTVTGITGCTILGDGSISLILDLDNLT